MRIVFYAPRASHLKPGESGDRVFVRDLLAALQERGHQVDIASLLDVRDFWRGRVPTRRLVTEAISVYRAIKRSSPDAWLVFNSSMTCPDFFGWWQKPKRYVLFKTDAGTTEALPRAWRWPFALAHRRSLARADKIVAERPKSASQLRSIGVEDERLSILPLAVRTWDSIPSREAARRHLELPPEAPIVLCVSRLTAANDHRTAWKTEAVLELVQALALLPSELMLVLVGDGPGRERVEERVADLKLGARVRYAGAIANDAVRWFYAACDFFAYPTLNERMLNVMLEAQACGRPVVAMRNRSTELIIDDGRTGLLAQDREELQAHLLALASDRARCQAMGEAGPQYIARSHSMQARVQQIEDMLVGQC